MTYTAPFRLRHINAYGEVWYFQNLGLMWPHNPTKRLIERTTRHLGEAREFATVEEANETIVVAGQPPGWQIIGSEGNVVE